MSKEYILPIDKIERFKLDEDFIKEYKKKEVPWGFGDLSLITYRRTYSRQKDDGSYEKWFETCQRVIEGMYTIQKAHCFQNKTSWKESKAQESAQEAYDRLFTFKWTPPGRGLWMMGTDFIYERSGAPLNNCAFISTKDIDKDFADPFGWSFEMSMLGCGVGFDTRGKGKVIIQTPEIANETHVVGDSREGWRGTLERVLNAYVGKDTLPKEFDYSEVRPKGSPIKSFGGVASGPAPLKKMVETLCEMYDSYIGKEADSRLIVDTMNIAGKCVVSGGVRRTAQISFSEKDDEQFLDLKMDQEKVNEYRWASNNSIFAEVGQDYSGPSKRTKSNGEPGYFWLENAQKFGRMSDPPNYKDSEAIGGNPCLEQTLWDRELCTLVETYPFHHESLEDYLRTLKFAYLYAKTVTLVPTHDKETNEVMLKNRRIGCSMSGIVQNIEKIGLRSHIKWCDEGYNYIQKVDKTYSDWLGIPRSIKTTSVKPSGTVSILAGATPGIHFEESQFFIRRVRVQSTSSIWKACDEAGYHVEDDSYSDDTKVVEFPVKVDKLERGKVDVSLWEKLELAALHQEHWADNQVSCTITFLPEEAEDIEKALEIFEHRLKGISFLPYSGHGYDQAPYEEITEEKYKELKNKVERITEQDLEEAVHDQDDKFCSGEACKVDFTQ